MGLGIISRLRWRSRKTRNPCWYALSLRSSLCLPYCLISMLRRQREDKKQNTFQITINFKSLLIVFCFLILLDVFLPVFSLSIFSKRLLPFLFTFSHYHTLWDLPHCYPAHLLLQHICLRVNTLNHIIFNMDGTWLLLHLLNSSNTWARNGASGKTSMTALVVCSNTSLFLTSDVLQLLYHHKNSLSEGHSECQVIQSLSTSDKCVSRLVSRVEICFFFNHKSLILITTP